MCTNKTCDGQVKTDSAVNVILKETELNHDKMSERKVQSILVKGHCKRKASEDLSSRPSKIILQELVSNGNTLSTNVDINSRSTVDNDIVNIRLAVYHEKRKYLPTSPKTLFEVMQQLKGMRLFHNCFS